MTTDCDKCKGAPYNTGKVLIGCNYQIKQHWQPSRTDNMLQTALLDKRKGQSDWDGVVIVLGCFAAVAIVYAWLWGMV